MEKLSYFGDYFVYKYLYKYNMESYSHITNLNSYAIYFFIDFKYVPMKLKSITIIENIKKLSKYKIIFTKV
jgi:hypothetical protein